MSANPNRRIDLVGHSRGGYIVIEVARRLQAADIDVRFLGLYDPVDMAVGYGEAETISSNVKTAAVIYGSGSSDETGIASKLFFNGQVFQTIEMRSRSFFNRADGGPVSATTDFDQIWLFATHSAIGGAAWNGDGPIGHSDLNDREKAVESDQHVRNKARSKKLPIHTVGDEDDYGYESLGDPKERPRG